MSIAPKLNEKYTYEDYLKWEEARWEIINGVPYNMSPAPSRIHQKILFAFARLIGNYLENKTCDLYTAPFDVRLPEPGEKEETSSTVVQPDISVICDMAKLDDKGCNGAPDLIIEVLSESTAAKDMNEKLFLYQKHGVREYWIVDIWDKTVKTYVIDKYGRYMSPFLYRKDNDIEVNIFTDLIINLSMVFKD